MQYKSIGVSTEDKLSELQAFNNTIYNKSILSGNIAAILAKRAGSTNINQVKFAGYMADIGVLSIKDVFRIDPANIHNPDLLPLIPKLLNTQKMHIRLSMIQIDYLKDVAEYRKQPIVDIIDLHHVHYNNLDGSVCGHNTGNPSSPQIPQRTAISKEAQILHIATMLADDVIDYDLFTDPNIVNPYIDYLYQSGYISREIRDITIDTSPTLITEYNNKSLTNADISFIQTWQNIDKDKCKEI